MATTSTKISELITLSTMTDIAFLPVVEGLATKRITGLNLKNYFTSGAVTSTSVLVTGGVTSLSTNTGSLQVRGGAGLSGNLYVGGTLIIAAGNAPATASSTGTAGQVVYDSGFIYVCVATNTWKRSALTTW